MGKNHVSAFEMTDIVSGGLNYSSTIKWRMVRGTMEGFGFYFSDSIALGYMWHYHHGS